MQLSNDKLWCNILEHLRLQMTEATFDTWVRNTSLLERDEARFVIDVQNTFAKDWLDNRLRVVIERTITSLYDIESPELRFEVTQPTRNAPLPEPVTDSILDGFF